MALKALRNEMHATTGPFCHAVCVGGEGGGGCA